MGKASPNCGDHNPSASLGKRWVACRWDVGSMGSLLLGFCVWIMLNPLRKSSDWGLYHSLDIHYLSFSCFVSLCEGPSVLDIFSETLRSLPKHWSYPAACLAEFISKHRGSWGAPCPEAVDLCGVGGGKLSSALFKGRQKERGKKRKFQQCIWEAYLKVERNGVLFSTMCNYIPVLFGNSF